jgi:thymidylate synthase (FAD)
MKRWHVIVVKRRTLMPTPRVRKKDRMLNVFAISIPTSLTPAYLAARVCYSREMLADIQIPSEETMERFLRDKVLARGHWGILEHLPFTIGIEGISRTCSHQLVRTRIASFGQRSQRYVDETAFGYVVPSMIQQDAVALQLFTDAMVSAQAAYGAIAERLLVAHPGGNVNVIKDMARAVLPNATATQLVMSVNGRQLIDIAHKRCCSRAHEEYIALWTAIREQIVRPALPLVAEYMYAACRTGKCYEREGCPCVGGY